MSTWLYYKYKWYFMDLTHPSLNNLKICMDFSFRSLLAIVRWRWVRLPLSTASMNRSFSIIVDREGERTYSTKRRHPYHSTKCAYIPTYREKSHGTFQRQGLQIYRNFHDAISNLLDISLYKGFLTHLVCDVCMCVCMCVYV
jgi:hypothetical protein